MGWSETTPQINRRVQTTQGLGTKWGMEIRVKGVSEGGRKVDEPVFRTSVGTTGRKSAQRRLDGHFGKPRSEVLQKS